MSKEGEKWSLDRPINGHTHATIQVLGGRLFSFKQVKSWPNQDVLKNWIMKKIES